MSPHAVKSAQDALFVAIRMEQRAIGLYERALLLSPAAPLAEAIRRMLRDERRHLQQFEALADPNAIKGDAALLAAQAADMLHAGGLMGAAREGAFADAHSLVVYAACEEESAVARYQAFADACTGEARDMFLLIAGEEAKHLQALRVYLEGADT